MQRHIARTHVRTHVHTHTRVRSNIAHVQQSIVFFLKIINFGKTVNLHSRIWPLKSEVDRIHDAKAKWITVKTTQMNMHSLNRLNDSVFDEFSSSIKSREIDQWSFFSFAVLRLREFYGREVKPIVLLYCEWSFQYRKLLSIRCKR